MHISNHFAGLAMLAGQVLVHAAADSPPLVQDRSDTQFHTTSGATGDAFCDTLCQQFKDGQMVSSIGSTIEGYIAAGGLNGGHSDHRYDIIRGSHVSSGSDGSCGNEPSSIWKLWAQAHAHAFPNQLNNLGSDVGGSGKICIDAAQLARLTAAATQCYSHLRPADGGSNASGGGSSHSWSSSSWSTGYGTGSMGNSGSGSQQPLGGQGGGGNTGDNTQHSDAGMGNGNRPDNSIHGNSGSSSASGGEGQHDGSSGSTGGGSGSTINGGHSSINTNLGGNSDSISGGSEGSHTSITGNTGTTSTSTWGTGNVHNSAICFKIKDKRTDRYLTTYGSEYAFARLTGYYSIFRAYPAKGVDKGFTLTEVNRNGGAVNYPVKLMTGTGVFKPLYGDKDAVWTFNPVNFGDSCWGVPGKKMQARSDWGGWGPNYRQASSGDDCVDVELEEADC